MKTLDVCLLKPWLPRINASAFRQVTGHVGFIMCILAVSSCQHTANSRFSLRIALEKGDFSEAKELVEACPALVNGEFAIPAFDETETSYSKGHSLLSHFVADYDKASWLIKHGANVNAGAFDWPPLVAASACGNLPLVKLLIEHGAIGKLESGSGHTALFEAVTHGHYNVADFLLSKDLSLNRVCSDGNTVLDQVVEEIHLIGDGEDFGGQERVAELKKAEAWIRQHGGKFHIEIARRWVKERNEHDDLLRKHYKKSMTPEEIEDFLKNKP